MKFQGISKTDIISFLELARYIPVVDVRSPSEFNYGHIPGAVNIPLFDDKEREIVGTRYRKDGRIKAILAGLELSGPSMHLKLQQALNLAGENRLLLHCWRGGMRSEAMAWLFSLGGIDCQVLESGYKAYRHYVLETLSLNKKMIVLGGLTGSGKTEILRYLSNAGNKVVDLEGLANHKGSAFGSLGQKPQPSSEHFTNMLFNVWKEVIPDQILWIEDESRNIGTVFMPEEFYLNMQKNPAIILMMDLETRLPRLLKEYSGYSPAELEASVMKISKRLGGDNTRDALNAVRRGDFTRAIEITLTYYDKAYLYGLKRKVGKNIVYVKTDTDNISANAIKILDAAENIVW